MEGALIVARWARLEELFERASAQPADARRQFLIEACGSDAELFNEVERLLAAAHDDRALAIERLVVDGTPSFEPRDPSIGSVLGPWRLVSVLGRGGMGSVYRGERADGQYRQDVAVKLLRSGPRDPFAVDRFRIERQVLARLIHPNIAALLDGGVAPDGTPYLVMELVDGVPVTDWCAAQRLSLDARLRLFRVVCDAVQHAHRALIVHRDLKPSNILVSQSGAVKLLDFGIAKLLDPSAWEIESQATRADMRLLTPEYAAPEQRRDGQITTAADVYALGVVLYELLTGSRPDLTAVTPLGAPSEIVRRASSTADAAHARRLARRMRGDLDRIVLVALRQEPERRYASAGQLGEEIGRFLEGRAVLAQPDTLRYRVRKFVGRNRVAVAAAAVLMLSVTTFGVLAAVQARALAEQSRVARLERDTSEQVVQVLVDLFASTNPAVRPDGGRMTIREFLDDASDRALAQLRGTPVVRARLQHVLGLIQYERGAYAPARAAIEEALAEQRRLVGADHPDALESLHALGEIVRSQGDAATARGLLEESLDRHRRLYGADHEKTARAQFALAPVVARTDREGARRLMESALAIQRRTLPPNHPDIAVTLSALAEYHRQNGDLQQSQDLYQQALAVFGDGGPVHPREVTLLNDYAALLSTINDNVAAEAVQRRAIYAGEQVLGPVTLTVAEAVNNLGVTLASEGRHAEAERTFRDAIERHVALLGSNHLRVRSLMRSLGMSIALQQRFDEALPWMDRALAIADTGDKSADDAGRQGIRAQRAWILFRIGRRAEAVEEARRAVTALERLTDATAEYPLAFSRVLLARLATESGRPADAEPLARAALGWLDRWGASNPKHAEAECELGRAQLLVGAIADGRAHLEQCMPVYRAWGQADPIVVASADQLLATRGSENRPGR